MIKALLLISVSFISVFSAFLLISRSSTAEKIKYTPIETVEIPDAIRKEAEEAEKESQEEAKNNPEKKATEEELKRIKEVDFQEETKTDEELKLEDEKALIILEEELKNRK